MAIVRGRVRLSNFLGNSPVGGIEYLLPSVGTWAEGSTQTRNAGEETYKGAVVRHKTQSGF